MTKIRTGAQFCKNDTGESHVFVQAFNDAETASYLYESTAAVPATGNFSLVRADASGAGIARMTPSPNRSFVYVNGKETLITGGNEYRIGKFLDWDSVGNTYKYDYTEQVTNSVVAEFAVCHRVVAAIDSNTMLLLHLDNNLTDSKPSGPHAMTGPNVTFTTSSKFGTYAAVFNGTNANITTPDSADFDLSGGIWTIDFWSMSPYGGLTEKYLFYQGTDANNYMAITAYKGPSGHPSVIQMRIVAAGVNAVVLYGDVYTGITPAHVAFVESGNSYYMFVNGNLVASATSANRAANYTGAVYIGSDSTPGNYITTTIDEFRVSNSARWVSSFSPPTSAYGTDAISEHFIVTSIPVKGFKYYIGTANATASVASAFYWGGAGYAAVTTFSDGTSVGGKALAQTGTISFDDTSAVVKTRAIGGVYGFWYKLSFTNLDITTTYYQVTANTGMVPLQDLWDGVPRVPLSFQKYDGTKYSDFILNISQSYLSTEVSTYFQMNGLTTAMDMEFGFTEQLTGLIYEIIDGYGNTTLNSFQSVAYYDGTAYVNVGTIQDGTTTSVCSFANSGTVTWNAPTESVEQKRSIKNDNYLYYYKVSVSTTIGNDTRLLRVFGIPAQKVIRGFGACTQWKERLVLACEKAGKRNLVRIAAQDTSVVLNGSDTYDFELGDSTDVMAVGAVFNRYGGNLTDALICPKVSQTWIIDQLDVSTFKKYSISDSSGCPSPETFRTCDVGVEISPGINKHVGIWHTGTGVVMFDQNSLLPIDDDIRNYWEDWRPEYINVALIDKFTSSYDDKRREYHLCIATGANTTLDTELVFSLLKRRWSKIDRTSGNRLLCSFPVSSTLGNRYHYGCDANGFMHRLEYGTTFNGQPIVATVKAKPQVNGSIAYQSTVRHLRPIFRSKNITTNKLTVKHYADFATVGTTVPSVSLSDATHGIANGKDTKKSVVLGPATFHEFELSLSTSDEAIGMEPIALVGFAQVDRIDVGG